METPKDNDDSTPLSPEPSYSSDSYEEPFQITSISSKQEKEDESSGTPFDMSFETIDGLVLEEMLDPQSECDGIPEWPHPLPDVGKYWTDLNSHDDNGEMIEEETSTVEPNGNDLGQEEPKEESQKSTNEKIIEVLLNEFEKDPKAFKPYGKSILMKVEQLTGVKSSAMPSRFRGELNPMIPSLDLETDLHMSFMKKARTVIGEEDKEKLENKHGVIIILNPKGRIEKWSKKSQGARGEGQVVGSVKVVNRLVDYSSSEDEPSE